MKRSKLLSNQGVDGLMTIPSALPGTQLMVPWTAVLVSWIVGLLGCTFEIPVQAQARSAASQTALLPKKKTDAFKS